MEIECPWGFYQVLWEGEGYQIKKLVVLPGKKLSLQYHHQRSEHWVIVKGSALVQVGDDSLTLGKNGSIYIPKGVKHRITNNGVTALEIVETQVGNYLGEDDIVRLDDDYGRI